MYFTTFYIWQQHMKVSLLLKLCKFRCVKNTNTERETFTLSLSLQPDCSITRSHNAMEMQICENFGRGVGAGRLRGGKQESVRTNHHHHVNARLLPLSRHTRSSSSSSSLLPLYKSRQSPSREHGGSSSSQVSGRSAPRPRGILFNTTLCRSFLSRLSFLFNAQIEAVFIYIC